MPTWIIFLVKKYFVDIVIGIVQIAMASKKDKKECNK